MMCVWANKQNEFERVVRDYISEFALENLDNQPEDDDGAHE